MKIDIVPIKETYRGIDRALLATDLLTQRGKKDYRKLLNAYDVYCNMSLQHTQDREMLEWLICFEKTLQQYGVGCEIIAYDTQPIDSVYGHSVEWLGIDITHDLCESLLEDIQDARIDETLNKNGLCTKTEDMSALMPMLDVGDVIWEACHVYRVLEE